MMHNNTWVEEGRCPGVNKKPFACPFQFQNLDRLFQNFYLKGGCSRQYLTCTQILFKSETVHNVVIPIKKLH